MNLTKNILPSLDFYIWIDPQKSASKQLNSKALQAHKYKMSMGSPY